MPGKYIDTDRRLQAAMVLKELYAAYDIFAHKRNPACRPGCHLCCGDAMLLTTLEGRLLADALETAGRGRLLKQAAEAADRQVAPAATFNQHAAGVLTGHDPKEEPPRGQGYECPLVVDGLCAAYDARPFACRAMSSREVCQPGGSALQDEWWVVLDTAFFQLVEQVDTGGGFGPLGKVAAWLQSNKLPHGLLPCQDLPGLPAPASHSARLSEAIKAVMARPLGGRPLGDWIGALRRT